MEDILSFQLIKRIGNDMGVKVDDIGAKEILLRTETELCRILRENSYQIKDLPKDCVNPQQRELAQTISKDPVYMQNIINFLNNKIPVFDVSSLNGELPSLVACCFINVISKRIRGE